MSILTTVAKGARGSSITSYLTCAYNVEDILHGILPYNCISVAFSLASFEHTTIFYEKIIIFYFSFICTFMIVSREYSTSESFKFYSNLLK